MLGGSGEGKLHQLGLKGAPWQRHHLTPPHAEEHLAWFTSVRPGTTANKGNCWQLALQPARCLKAVFTNTWQRENSGNLMTPPLTNPCSSHVDVWNHTQDSILAAFRSLQGNLETLCDSMMAGNLINLNHLQLYFFFFLDDFTWCFTCSCFLGVQVG